MKELPVLDFEQAGEFFDGQIGWVFKPLLFPFSLDLPKHINFVMKTKFRFLRFMFYVLL